MNRGPHSIRTSTCDRVIGHYAVHLRIKLKVEGIKSLVGVAETRLLVAAIHRSGFRNDAEHLKNELRGG